MKEIQIRIPTSWQEVKVMTKCATDKRYKHNRELLISMHKVILARISSNYWKNDVSDYFRENFSTTPDNGLKDLLDYYLKQLK